MSRPNKKLPLCIHFIGLVLVLLSFSSNAQAKDIIFYVAPDIHGVRFGKTARLLSSGGEHVAGLSAVLEAAQAVRGKLGQDVGIKIFLHGGSYQLSAPLVLTPEDSNLTIAACQGEKPVISGGQIITVWKQVTGKTNWWRAKIPDGPNGKWYFHSLFVNGRRAQRARTPNVGSYFYMQGARFADKPMQFHFKPGDIDPQWVSDSGLELVGYEAWTCFRLHLHAVDAKNNSVQLTGNGAPWTHENAARYFVENTAEALDAPGEWFLDKKTGVLTYIAKPGENLTSAKVMAPKLASLVFLKGDFSGGRPLHNVVLRGLTFSYTDWTMPTNGFVDMQASVGIRGDVRAEAATDCLIEHCIFTQLGNYALDLGRGCQNDRIIGCEMTDLGGGGIRIGETEEYQDSFSQNFGQVITDNHIHKAGLIFPSAVGVLILQSGTNLVAHNEIDHLNYTAISVGWTWGYKESACRENVIKYNHIHHIGQDVLSDLGGIYTLGPQEGTIISHNLIHDIESFTYGGWGIYTDEGSSDIMIKDNVVYNTKTGGFHQHYGQDNVISNNVFAYSRQWQIQMTKPEKHRSFTFANNIVYWNQGGLYGGPFDKGQELLESNVYWKASGKPVNFMPISLHWQGKDINTMIANLTNTPILNLEQWQARGFDQGSILADPLFVAADKFDFRLRSNSPALKMGFKPIDLNDVGVR